MARDLRITIDGLDRMQRSMVRAAGRLDDLKVANAAAARIVAEAAALAAPRRTGRLAASIRGSRAVGSAVIRAGGARVPYAQPIHWGWAARHISANPFISRAAQATESQWTAYYQDAVQRVLDDIEGA